MQGALGPLFGVRRMCEILLITALLVFSSFFSRVLLYIASIFVNTDSFPGTLFFVDSESDMFPAFPLCNLQHDP